MRLAILKDWNDDFLGVVPDRIISLLIYNGKVTVLISGMELPTELRMTFEEAEEEINDALVHTRRKDV